MKLLLSTAMFLILIQAFSQFRPKVTVKKYELSFPANLHASNSSPFGLKADEQRTYKFQSPALTTLTGTNSSNQFQSMWINNVTSQSYNNGKFGTYYYWDVQGNLRDTRGFIDISGKNKRGFKLLFPWR